MDNLDRDLTPGFGRELGGFVWCVCNSMFVCKRQGPDLNELDEHPLPPHPHVQLDLVAQQTQRQSQASMSGARVDGSRYLLVALLWHVEGAVQEDLQAVVTSCQKQASHERDVRNGFRE